MQICKEQALHPCDAIKRSEHKRWCFSKQQICGKCKIAIWETKLQQFAILSCRHPFCLECISEEWPTSRSAKYIDLVSSASNFRFQDVHENGQFSFVDL